MGAQISFTRRIPLAFHISLNVPFFELLKSVQNHGRGLQTAVRDALVLLRGLEVFYVLAEFLAPVFPVNDGISRFLAPGFCHSYAPQAERASGFDECVLFGLC